MPVSKRSSLLRRHTGAAKVLYAILVISLMLFWFNQNSIRLYCQQKYHDGCDIPALSQNPEWRLGAQLNQQLEEARVAFFGRFEVNLVAQAQAASEDEPLAPLPSLAVEPDPQPEPSHEVAQQITHQAAHELPSEPLPAAHPLPAPDVEAPAPATVVETSHPAPPALPLVVTLAEGDEVFFVGDSLMQGVAPHMANTLRKRYNVKSTNLSRQSTGLAYPSFFNWPKTVESTLAANPKIRLMVIFLGPNDPWDMPDGKGKPFLRFKHPDWEVAYRQRIDSILDVARDRGVQVIWVGPPNMEKAKLSAAMAYLNELYKSQIELYHQHFVSANRILGYENDTFSYYLTANGQKKVKTRVDDGIHFTPTGQKLIAEGVLSLIQFPTPQLTEH